LLAFDMRTAGPSRSPCVGAGRLGRASPFDAACCLRLVTDAVHEDDTLCLALTCRTLRDALWDRFPARSAGHAHAGKRLRTRGVAVAELGAKVTIAGVLDLTNMDHTAGAIGAFTSTQGLRAPPEGVGKLAHLPWPGLKKLVLRDSGKLTALPVGLWLLVRLEELDLSGCRLTALPDEVTAMAGLRKLDLSRNELEPGALPEGLWSLVGLQEL
jgi:Leucine-rich repeat (LRR) protein